jgi:hypothetical protein
MRYLAYAEAEGNLRATLPPDAVGLLRRLATCTYDDADDEAARAWAERLEVGK